MVDVVLLVPCLCDHAAPCAESSYLPADTRSERFVYFPFAFLVISVTMLLRLAIDNRKLLLLLVGCVLLASVLALHRLNRNWRTSGEICKQLVSDITAVARADVLVVINLPDSINGAPIYHMGLTDSVRLFGRGCKFNEIVAIAYHDVSSKGDEVDVKRCPDGYSVQLLNAKTRFRYFAGSAGFPERLVVRLRNVTPTAFELCLEGLGSQDRLLFYSAGHLHPVQQSADLAAGSGPS